MTHRIVSRPSRTAALRGYSEILRDRRSCHATAARSAARTETPGHRFGAARQTAQEQEHNEIDGSLGLSTLRRAVEALDCQLVYAFVPKTSFDESVRAQARKVAMAELSRVDQTMLLEGQRVEGSEAEERLTERVEELIGSRQLWSPIPRAES